MIQFNGTVNQFSSLKINLLNNLVMKRFNLSIAMMVTLLPDFFPCHLKVLIFLFYEKQGRWKLKRKF
jgi:hypothetical protein